MQVLENKDKVKLRPAVDISRPEGEKEAALPRKRGRPPKHLTREPTEADKRWNNNTRTTFPRPPNGVRIKSPTMFFKYWRSLTEAMIDRASIKIYRTWPVINPLLAGAKTRVIADFQNDPIQKTSAVCPFSDEGWKDELLHLHGSGDYKMIINEIGVSGAIAECQTFSVRDNMIPPRVDIRTLVIGDPLNAGYIQELRQRGVKLPGDLDFKSETDETEGEDMRAVEQLTSAVVQMAERASQPVPVAPVRASAEDQATTKGLDIMAKAMEYSGSMLKTSQEQAAQLQGKQVDPIQMLTTLGTVMKEMVPQKEGTEPLVKLLMEQNAALQREMRDRDERRAKEEQEWRRREEERHAQESERRDREYRERLERDKPKTLAEQLRERNEIEELLGAKRRKRDDDDEDGEKSKEGVVEKIITYMPLVVSGLTTLATLGANIIYNMRVKPGEAPQPVPAAAAAATQQQAQTALTGVTPEQQAQQEQLHAFLQTIEQPLLVHFFNTDLNGYTFAEHIMTGSVSGPMIYAQMKNNGKDALLQVLSTYPPIWQKIGGLQPKLHAFADEFMSYEEWKNQLLNEEEEEGEAVN